MSLTFEKVDEILKSYGLVSHPSKNGKCTEYQFQNRVLNIRKRNVVTQVTQLLNGGVGGYIYIDHLREYDKHPGKTKMGHIPIGEMSVIELKTVIEKVIVHYK